jgi:hypothetical protein
MITYLWPLSIIHVGRLAEILTDSELSLKADSFIW